VENHGIIFVENEFGKVITMEKIDLTGVPETMIQTLYARAKESRKPNHIIYDQKAIEIVQKLDYSFSAADKDVMMSSGVVARTLLLDRMVKEYVNNHSDLVVVNIACGMDTRFYRVDNGEIRWYNVDLPETIEVRQRFFIETGRVSMIAASAMDERWADEIDKENGSVLIIIEGLTMYLTEKDVRTILNIIGKHFINVTVFMEIMSPMVAKKVEEKSIKASNAKFTWGAKSGKELEQMVPDLSFQTDRSLMETMPEIYPIYKMLGKLPLVYDLSNKIAVLSKNSSC